MAGEPALTKVQTALKAALEAAMPGWLVEADRADDSPLGNAELPALNIRYRGTVRDTISNCEVRNRARFGLSLAVSVEEASTIAARLREAEADIGAALWADRTLGGLIFDYEIASTDGDEDVLSDEGGRELDLTLSYLTPVGDDRTIIGAAGLVP